MTSSIVGWSLRGVNQLAVVVALLLSLGACGDDDVPPLGGFGGGGSGADDGGQDDGGGGMSDSGMDASAANGGSGGSGGSAGADDDGGMIGQDASVEPAPDGWLCPDRLYRDGYCDCGCGLIDPACLGLGCAEPGCIDAACVACFAENGAWQPCAAGTWTCEPALQADTLGICDCGCGAADPDCQGRGCTGADCRADSCTRCHDDSGADISCAAPLGWACALGAYGSGDGCDCGCGIVDPDCDGAGCADGDCRDAACDVCRDVQGDVSPCDVPSEWACNPLVYDAGDGCDCGCGVADPDCDGDGCEGNSCTDAACTSCHYDGVRGSCTMPEGWVCHPVFYAHNGVCDCGCGAIDPECGGEGCTPEGCAADGCDLCHDEQGGFAVCEGWSCESTQPGAGDGCDCGCGVADPDCSRLPSCTEAGCEVDTCESCNDGADRTTCGTGWTCSLEAFGDGACDCGCGAPDPDCDGAGCTGAGCLAAGCGLCHGTNGRVTLCESGVCAAGRVGSGDGCDCGCGVVDPDCGDRAACTQPGCTASACDRCFDPLGRVINCL